MPSPTHPEFSFDLYPGLDADLQAAYERNIALGTAEAPEGVATTGLAAAVQGALGNQTSPNSLSMAAEVRAWADPEIELAASKWERYSNIEPPKTDMISRLKNPNFAATMNRLYEAKIALDNSSELTPSNEPIGETMHLVMVPWGAFRRHLNDIPGLVNEMRSVQGITNEDFFNDDLKARLDSDQPLYKSWDKPALVYTARDYLEDKIKQDGMWGTVLVQTSNDAGVKSLMGKSPDEMISMGTVSPEIAGQEVGSMGIFEWLALTLQEDPRKLSSSDYSWMLANRLHLNSGPRVPSGDFGGDQVKSFLFDAGNGRGDIRVRLAVM